jgi:hypothetical protein
MPRKRGSGLLKFAGEVYSFRRVRPIIPMMTNGEKRFDTRIRSKGIVTLLSEGSDPVEASIYDVSPSGLGLGLETQASLAPGAAVEIHGAGFAADGVVRYSYRMGQVFRLGIELTPVETA